MAPRSFSISESGKLNTHCAALALLVCACSQGGNEDAAQRQEIRYTEYGIPHILANDYEALGRGQGYAQARDNLCKIEHGMLAFDGKLSRYFGPDAEGTQLIGTDQTSLTSDLYFSSLNQSGIVETLLAQAAPLGPREEVRQMVKGYVAGFNRYLAEAPEVECSGAEWLRPMVELDVYKRVYAVTTAMGQAFFVNGIIDAVPPSASSEARLVSDAQGEMLALTQGFGDPKTRPGSNAIALGRDATVSGRGINVANPHLAWTTDVRWWQTQLTIPGELNVAGGALIGVPFVVMGHTARASWSITTAERARRFTLFELTLAEDSPTTYLVDGVPEPMQRREVSVEVKRPSGALETVTNIQWWTRYGPVVGNGLPWMAGGPGEPGHAYAIGDANATNLRMLNTLFAFNHAQSTGDVLDAIRSTQGVPWWTVVAADSEGQTLLSQIQVLPNVTDEQAERCNTELGKLSFASEGTAILDGSRSDCAWQTDPDAVEPGIFGPGELDNPRLPLVLGSRYLSNSNDSHWLPAADVRITGMPRIVGMEGDERTMRTRGLISELERQVTRAGYTRQATAELVLSNRSYAAELALEPTVAMCRSLSGGKAAAATGESVDVSQACEILARWDGCMDTNSPGALLFTRYWSRAFDAAAETEESLWAVPFDPQDPVHTPNTLAIDSPFLATALADAVLELSGMGIPLDAPLGDYQYDLRDGKRIPVGGGTASLGVVNVMEGPFGGQGFAESHYGSGYMHVVAFDDSPCPDAVTLLSYSQSDEPGSPHHSDQTELYSQKKWVTERFCESEILTSPALEIVDIE